MDPWHEKIESLQIDLFDGIPSQTGWADRRSLLAVQRAVARRHGTYAYLEIGSHLGGSIQPHLVDERCLRIFSIDARPAAQPDDRAPGYTAEYEDNSSARMLALLAGVGAGDLRKIVCFDSDASRVEAAAIDPTSAIAFIDGEHTSAAVRADFSFCERVVDPDGVVLFHDFSIVYPTLFSISRVLAQRGRPHLAFKLEGDVFGIFFEPGLVRDDPYLASLQRRSRYGVARLLAEMWLKRSLPEPVLASAKSVRDRLRRAPVGS